MPPTLRLICCAKEEGVGKAEFSSTDEDLCYFIEDGQKKVEHQEGARVVTTTGWEGTMEKKSICPKEELLWQVLPCSVSKRHLPKFLLTKEYHAGAQGGILQAEGAQGAYMEYEGSTPVAVWFSGLQVS